MILIPPSCTMSQTSIHSTSVTLSIRSQSLESICHFHCLIIRDLFEVIPERPLVFAYFLQMKSEFDTKEFMIWATVSSQFSFRLYRTSPSLAAKNNQSDFGIDHLVMFMCRVVCCVVGRGCLLWSVCSLGKTLLAFALLHFVLQGQACSYSRYLLTSYFCIPVSYDENDISFFGISSKRSCRSS